PSRHHDHAQRTGRLRRSRGSGRHHHPRPSHRRRLGNAHHHRVAGSAGMTAMTIEHPSTLVEPGALSRWNPSIKLISLFVLSVSLLFVWEPVRPALLWVVLVIVSLTIGNVPPRWLMFAHIPFFAFGFGLFLVNVLAREENGAFIGAALAGRTLVIGVASILFLTSTSPVDLMRSLNQNLKLPASMTFAILAGYQLLLSLPREWQHIR